MGLVRGAMRHYCLGGCSALVVCVRRSRPVPGGWGRCRVLCLPRFPLPAPRFLRCVWRAVLSGCRLSSLAGTPFHAVCVFHVLGPVAFLVFPACPLCVCALALSRRPRPPPSPRVGVACAPRAVPVLGAGRAVPLGLCPSACRASVPCSIWLAWGGAARSFFPLPGSGLRAPRGVGAGVGTRHQPNRARSCELALRAGLVRCRSGTRAPRGGASCLGAGRPGSGALPPRPLVLSGVQHRPTTHWLLVRGVRAWGPVTKPPARALASWLWALWGRHEVAQGRPPLAWVWGVRGRALSRPRALVLSGVRPGPTTQRLWVRGVRAWGPLTNPTARTLAYWVCALWGRHEGDRGGRLLPGCGASGVGRCPIPDHSSFWACGQGPLPTGYGCGGCGRGDPSPTQQRALLRAGFARCGGGMMLPGGGASCLGVGRLRSGALPPPTTRFFGRAAWAHYPLAVGAGDAGVGTRHQPHSARPCELALRAVGAA